MKIFFVYIVSILAIVVSSCTSNSNSEENVESQKTNTRKRPKLVSPKASLVNVGSKEEPIFTWMEFTSPFTLNNKIYKHIIGIKYTFANDTLNHEIRYFESMPSRLSNQKINPEDFRLIDFPLSGTVKVTNGIDTTNLFEVVEKNGKFYSSIPTIRTLQNVGPISTMELPATLIHKRDSLYTLKLKNNQELEYISACGLLNKETKISFINRQDGNIYLLNKNCFLKIKNKEDLLKLNQDIN